MWPTKIVEEGNQRCVRGAGATSNFPLPYIYNFPNRRRTHKDVYINAGLQRAMRAPGHPQGCFLTEILMDELADRVKMDPVEFRVKNLPPAAPNNRCFGCWGSTAMLDTRPITSTRLVP